MTMTSTFDHDGEMELNAPLLEGRLRALWHEAAESGDGPPVARVQVLNLIIYTEDADSADLADKVMERLPESHPCRGIVLLVDPHTDRPLRASIAARCQVSPSGLRKVCSEEITVTAGANTRAVLVDALTPLLVADLPVMLWWTSRPRPADPVFRQFGRGLADRILLDSAAFRDPGAGLIALSRWRDDPRNRATIGDLTWERLRPWRHLLAQTVDPPDVRARLRLIDEVAITFHDDEVSTEEALLAAGWLSASFGWQPEDSPAHGVVTLRARSRLVTLRFVAVGRVPGDDPLHSIRLRTADGATFSVRLGEQPGVGICAASHPGAPMVERTAPLLQRDPLALVVAALGRPSHDPVYAAALGAAAEIAVLGATA